MINLKSCVEFCFPSKHKRSFLSDESSLTHEFTARVKQVTLNKFSYQQSRAFWINDTTIGERMVQ